MEIPQGGVVDGYNNFCKRSLTNEDYGRSPAVRAFFSDMNSVDNLAVSRSARCTLRMITKGPQEHNSMEHNLAAYLTRPHHSRNFIMIDVLLHLVNMR